MSIGAFMPRLQVLLQQTILQAHQRVLAQAAQAHAATPPAAQPAAPGIPQSPGAPAPQPPGGTPAPGAPAGMPINPLTNGAH